MEQSIKERMRDNEQLLLTLRKLSDRLRETGMGIDQLILQNPDVIEETKGQAIRDLSDVSICHPVTLCLGPNAFYRVTETAFRYSCTGVCVQPHHRQAEHRSTAQIPAPEPESLVSGCREPGLWSPADEKGD